MVRARATAPLAWLAWLVLLALAGCQTMGQLATEFDPGQRPEQKAYEEAIAPYLVQGVVYQGPALELKVTALPLTLAVRRAMLQRQAVALGWDQATQDKRLAEQEADAAQGLEVVVSLYAPEKVRTELTSPKADWRVLLDQSPALDTRAIKDRSALHEALYPFWGFWDSLYRLRFPPQAGPSATPVVTGALGRTELKLKLN